MATDAEVRSRSGPRTTDYGLRTTDYRLRFSHRVHNFCGCVASIRLASASGSRYNSRINRKRYVLAVTGGSGAVYGRRLLEVLAETGATIHFTLSEAAVKVIAHELATPLDLADAGVVRALLGQEARNVVYHHYKDLEVPIASGSYKTDGMVICPCSGGTLGRIACGVSSNLIERAADVCLKERRKLILVPRETPLSAIHLENMLKLTRAGAIVLPASPGFYGASDRVERLVDFVVSRVLDQLDVENHLMQRYGEPAKRRHPEAED